jgi:Cytochrome P450
MRTESPHTTLPGLPPGPRLPRAVQSVIWYRRAQWLMDQCQARFGEMFTLKIANEGDWVVTSDPDTIKQGIPFGGGIRRCLGALFAQFEMEVVLRELVLRRTLAPSRPESERVYRRAITETPRHDAEVLIGCPPTPCPAAAHAPPAEAVPLGGGAPVPAPPSSPAAGLAANPEPEATLV